jgi:hypothetical protein
MQAVLDYCGTVTGWLYLVITPVIIDHLMQHCYRDISSCWLGVFGRFKGERNGLPCECNAISLRPWSVVVHRMQEDVTFGAHLMFLDMRLTG